MNKVALHMVTDLREKIAEVEAENEARVTEFLDASNERLDRLDDTTVISTVAYTLSYDADGVLVSEV